MSSTLAPAPRRWISILAVIAMTTIGVVVGATIAPNAAADDLPGPGPVMQAASSMVTADALPTVQIDGVVWSQAIHDNTVYAGGSFANARPAGAASGTNQTPRSNLLAYNLSTGNLITSFAPSVNGVVQVVTLSPDGSRLYIGGAFTTVNGQTRHRIAAFDTATGALISSFRPDINTTVNAIAATNSTVYVGGLFTAANGQNRSKLAAFRASDGALLDWAPTADLQVDTMVITPDGSKVIAGGRFNTVNGVTSRGLAALDPSTGALEPWSIIGVVRNSGSRAGIYNLSADGDSVYGTGWGFGTVDEGNLEGAFRVDPDSGDIEWMENCHGDTYGAYSDGTSVYTVSHAHLCDVVGGFPESNPRYINMRHAIAFTKAVTGTMSHDPQAGGTYYDWYGTPSPSMYDWFPDFTVGTYTGQSQAAWDVTGNGQYVVMGGEFPKVNGTAQQGLVRFATRPTAPAKQGPVLAGTKWTASVRSVSPGTARIAFPANWDRDDMTLTYKIVRDGKTADPVDTQVVDSTFWNRPALGYVDTGLTPGSTHTYRVYAYDPDGNESHSPQYSVTVADGAPNPYVEGVLQDGASNFWRFDQASGSTTVQDWAGFSDLTAGSGVTPGTAGAIDGDTDTASTFSGSSSGYAASQTAIDGPQSFTISAWFKTTTRSGGKIVGFGDATSGNSSSYDRHVYMDNNGRIWFGVYPGSVQTLNTTGSYNDGRWHQVVASLSPAGMSLSLDGQQVASRTDITSAQVYSGYWRVGGDNLSGWTNRPRSDYFAGAIDDVAIFPTALSRFQVRTQYQTAGYSIPGVPAAPTDDFGKDVYTHDPSLYWRLGDAVGSTTAVDSGAYSNPGTVSGGVTFGQTGALDGVSNTAADFNGSNGYVVAKNSVSDPTTYSESAWFKTTTTSGGKIIGLGDSRSGPSTNNDRHVYMTDDGHLVFGTYDRGYHTLTTAVSYNDGTWHQVVATQGPDGMNLYVDGTLVASNAAYTNAQDYTGYWRVGGDRLEGWPDEPTSSYFQGTIDEAAVYSTELAGTEIANQYTLATGKQPNKAPTSAFVVSSLNGMNVSVDGSSSSDAEGPIASYAWSFGDGGTATGKTASHAYTAGGTFQVTLTVTDGDGATATSSRQIKVADDYTTLVNQSDPYLFWRLGEGAGATTALDSGDGGNDGTYQGGVTPGGQGSIPGSLSPTFDGSTGVVVAQTPVDNPTVYTEEAWFKTTSTAGGKIIGFGNAASGSSNNYDRHIYLDASGHVNFGVWTGSQNVITSPGTYNDGQWHQVVATQGPDGMTLYLDGQKVATGTQTAAQDYVGYWRVGGDTTWSGAPYFQGQIDNAAIYSTELDAATVLAHYGVGSGTTPSASFTDTSDGLAVDFDATGSQAANGHTITTYAWDFGDDETGTGANATHLYATSGTYTVTLTVTDDQGLTDTATQQVTVHQNPAASFTVTGDSLSASVDASASQAFDSASVAKYTWDWGDTTDPEDTTTATASHTYASNGTYTITLVVTDSTGATSAAVPKDVTVEHADPTVAFQASMDQHALTVDASGTTTSDSATIDDYTWDWGDGSAPGSGKTATHTYANDGDFTVKLTVTDSMGGTASLSKGVTASSHQAPTASFTANADGLSVSVDGSGSSAADGAGIATYSWDWGDGSDPQDTTAPTAQHTYATADDYTITLTVTDGEQTQSTPVTRKVTVTHADPVAKIADPQVSGMTVTFDGSGSTASDGAGITGYSWDFGDGKTSTAAKPSHTYDTAGTYPVTLTVTDGLGATSDPATVSVTVAAAPQVIAADAFSRSVSGGWGSADIGGAWTRSGAASNFSVSSGQGNISSSKGSGPSIRLLTPNVADSDVTVDISVDKLPEGGSVWVAAGARATQSADYRAKAQITTTGSVVLSVVRNVSGETSLQSLTIPGLTVTAGQELRLRLDVSGSSPTTIKAKIWDASTSEPSDWQISVTDSTAALQSAGGFMLYGYFSGQGTNGPLVTSFDNYSVTTGGSDEPPANQTPTAEFTSSITNLHAAVDGSGSSDPDGTVATYEWNWGDGSNDTVGASATATHTYAQPGTYTVKLTVTDNGGATDSATAKVTASASDAVPAFDHVVVVLEENRAEDAIMGNTTDAPYINSLAAQGANMTNSFAETHPSQPNYIALFSGDTQGVTDDSCPVGPFDVDNLGSQLIDAGLGFMGFAEDLPSVGSTVCQSPAVSPKYVRKHSPWTNFSNVPGSASVPFSQFPADAAGFANLPAVSFVIPNMDNDMHDGTVKQGDTWLQANMDAYVQWAKSNNSLFILSFDEDDHSDNNKIPTVIVGDGVAPGNYTEQINHYNVLRTIQDAFGMPSLLNSTSAAPITSIWGSSTGNQPPNAAFTPSTDGLTATVDASDSNDPDGTISSYSWDWGDNSANGSGKTASHQYAAAGTYTIKLTVTDNDNQTNSVSHDVTVSAPAGGAIAADAFTRLVGSGWGSADTGGAWAVSGGNADFSVGDGVGLVTVTTPGRTGTAVLPVDGSDVDVFLDMGLQQAATGGGIYSMLMARRSSNTFYSAKVRVEAGGSVRLSLVRTVNGSDSTLDSISVPGLSVGVGEMLRTHLRVTGTDPVSLAASVWKVGTSEPATWQTTATDSVGGVGESGRVGVSAYLSGTTTNAPVTIVYDNLQVATVH